MVRILASTLENGEAEFRECVERIKSQKEIEFQHHIISGLSERNAHIELARTWSKRKKDFDFLVKIDADTLLQDEYCLSRMSNVMISENASGIQIKLLDYFSNSLISGLNMFSSEVQFRTKVPRLRPDNFDFGHWKVLKGKDVEFLAPIGFHAKYPSPKQSFSFGYRRYLKSQYDVLAKCFLEWEEKRDDSRRWALIGAITAQRDKLSKIWFSSNQVEKKFLNIQLSQFSDSKLVDFGKIIRRLR